MSPSETRSTYHHGALREELITACLTLIESEGIGAVSLRRVAREAGVSPGAPYHHFADRAALLNTIAARGYEQLLADLRAAHGASRSPVRALGAMIETYVRFARSHPAYSQLMYRPELSHPRKDPATETLVNAVLRLVTDTVTDCQRTGHAPPGDPVPLVTMVWSIAAGLAMLSIDGPLDHMTADRGSDVPELTAQVSALLQGLLSGATGVDRT
ncbi:TetR/AcrR family transcriptional regulator [Amycolatopsis sp.]|uniref:TetR/AcrR family transcriptional regulator n=1 Tax=Amycolatopsis sp. TaxID=37632 RepID=UPI002B670E8B|nr:TetR/AcrR family transcriptional regulator [Amycolatopsis sp.]HVV09848.1 TetR/AcrR family transcriptional regulator [Amycolatopsis sp.]